MKNGEEFYEEFKEVVRFFGLAWADKKLIDVYVFNGEIMFQHGGKKIHVSFRNPAPLASLVTPEEAEQLANNGSNP